MSAGPDEGAPRPTEVCLSVDTEFSIAGAFADPERCRPLGEEWVTCPVDGREQGLGFLLDVLRENGLAASLFVETLNSCYFGDGPMGRIVARLCDAGQDVQLHLHPCWLYFRRPDWRTRLAAESPNDRCDGRGIEGLVEMMRLGLAPWRHWDGPPPTALRTGNLRADRTVYRAMASVGLRVASNLGVAYARPADGALLLHTGRHWIAGVLEVPVMSYLQVSMGSLQVERLLTITATSWPEMRSLLWRARACGVTTVVVLTHPHEFIKGDRRSGGRLRPNRINQDRLRRLCRFLADNTRDFRAATFGEAAPRWLAEGPVPSRRVVAPLLPVMGRMIQNKLNDLVPML